VEKKSESHGRGPYLHIPYLETAILGCSAAPTSNALSLRLPPCRGAAVISGDANCGKKWMFGQRFHAQRGLRRRHRERKTLRHTPSASPHQQCGTDENTHATNTHSANCGSTSSLRLVDRAIKSHSLTPLPPHLQWGVGTRIGRGHAHAARGAGRGRRGRGGGQRRGRRVCGHTKGQ